MERAEAAIPLPLSLLNLILHVSEHNSSLILADLPRHRFNKLLYISVRAHVVLALPNELT